MSATTTSRTCQPPTPALRPAPVRLVPAGLSDVTAAARLLELPPVPGTGAGEREALLRLALAHVALGAGAVWLVREEAGQAPVSAAALLPPVSHPDVAAMAWMAHLQLELPARPADRAGRPAQEAHLLLPPRRPAAALEVVLAALTGAEGRAVVSPVPQHPVVAAVLRAQGFSPDRAHGLLRRAG
jgi:hypothetical protein